MVEINTDAIRIAPEYRPLDVNAIYTRLADNQDRQRQRDDADYTRERQREQDARDDEGRLTLKNIGSAYAHGGSNEARPIAASAGQFDIIKQLDALDAAGEKHKIDALKAVSERTTPILAQLRQYPSAVRQGALQQAIPLLRQAGVDEQRLASLDTSDTGLDFAIANGMTISEYNGKVQSDRAYTAGRGDHADMLANQQQTRADVRRGQDITLRGQNMTDARAAATIAAKENAVFDPQTVTALAQQALEGDKSVFTGLGRGTQGSKNIALVRAEMTRQMALAGMSGKDIAAKNAEFGGKLAGARTMGNTGAKVDYGANELAASVPLALQASQGLPRGTFIPLTKVQQMLAAGNSDPKLKDFAVKTQAAMNAYNLVAARAGSSVGEREHNMTFLSTATSPEAYKAALDAMMQEADVAKDASKQTMSEVTGTKPHGAAPKIFRYDAKGDPVR